MIKAINDNLFLSHINEQVTTKSGMFIPDAGDLRYLKGKVISHGELCGKIKDGDIVYYDKARAFSVKVNDEPILAVKYQHLVGVDSPSTESSDS